MIAADAAVTGHHPGTMRLQLLHSHGVERSGALSIPRSGAGLAQALELGAEVLGQEERSDADLCRLGWQGQHWELSNRSRALVCVLNGERVASGVAVRVAPGDRLELGLHCFLMAAAEQPLGLDFDLRDLDTPQVTNAFFKRVSSDPFEMFGIIESDQGVARRVLPPVVVRTPNSGPRSSDPTHALFSGLHEESAQAVRDPARLAAPAATNSDGMLSADSVHAPTLEELSSDADMYLSVRGILHRRESIDQLIDGFDLLDRPLLLEAEMPLEVLRLFAPEFHRSVGALIPSLTLREHHALSPDSPMPTAPVRSLEDKAEGPSSVRERSDDH